MNSEPGRQGATNERHTGCRGDWALESECGDESCPMGLSELRKVGGTSIGNGLRSGGLYTSEESEEIEREPDKSQRSRHKGTELLVASLHAR